MKISKVEDMLTLTISKDMLKQAMGDGMEFELVYEALIKQIEENGSLSLSNNSSLEESTDDSTISYVTASAGQRLEDIPLRIRTVKAESETIDSENLAIGNENLVKDNGSDIASLYDSLKGTSSASMDEILSTVDKYSAKYGVDKNLVLAIIKHESNFDPNVVSSAGAKGLMQLMDFNSEAYGLTNPFDIDQNINAGVQHIKSYLDLYDGNVELGLMAYNAGPGTVSRRGVKSIDDLYKMPQETQNYVTKIMKQLNGN